MTKDIRRTKVYRKNVGKLRCVIDPRRFARVLKRASHVPECMFEGTYDTVAQALIWEHSKEGYNFWLRLSGVAVYGKTFGAY